MPAGYRRPDQGEAREHGFNQEAVARQPSASRTARPSRRSRPASAGSRPRSSCARPSVLAAPLDYFTDPFLLVGEGASTGARRRAGRRARRLRARGRAVYRRFPYARAEVGETPAAGPPALGLTRPQLRGRRGGRRALRGGARARRCAGRSGSPRSWSAISASWSSWSTRSGRLGRRLPSARTRRRADQPPRGARPA